MPRQVDYQAVSLELLDAIRDGIPVPGLLKKRCRSTVRQIQTDAACPELLALWGQSINVDEHVGKTIVPREVITTIEALACLSGRQRRDNVVHAGLEHAYGYLFSSLETPFGFKRDRWVKPDIEDGLLIHEPTLRPQPVEGTLLSNLTYFLGRIAFTRRPRELAILRKHGGNVSRVVTGYPYRRLSVVRVTETVRMGRPTTIQINTDFVAFGQPSPAGNSFLLVYSIQDTRQAYGQLITAFPVSTEFVREALVDQTRSRVRVQTHYNGFVSELTGQHRFGSREIRVISGRTGLPEWARG